MTGKSLRKVRGATGHTGLHTLRMAWQGVAVAMGENLRTLHEFVTAFKKGCVDFPQACAQTS